MFEKISIGLSSLLSSMDKNIEIDRIAEPRFKNASVGIVQDEGEEPDFILMSYVYECMNKLYNFSLPILLKLNKADQEQKKQKFKAPQEVWEENNRNNYAQRYTLFKYKPIFMLSAILFCIASITSINIAFILGGTALPVILGTPIALPLILSITAVFLTAAYIIPAAIFHYREKISKPRVLNLLKEAYLLIKKQQFDEAYKKMSLIQRTYGHLIYPRYNFPNNQEEQWLWNLINIMYSEANDHFGIVDDYLAVRRGLGLCKNDEERFIFIKAIINIRDRDRWEYKQPFDKHTNRYVHKTDAAINANLLLHQKYLLPFLLQIPYESIAHQDYCQAIHYKLKKINDLLSRGSFMKSGDEFEKIKWEGYHKHVLSKASIVYYQLRSIYTATHPTYLELMYGGQFNRFILAREILLKIERYLEFHYPDGLALQKAWNLVLNRLIDIFQAEWRKVYREIMYGIKPTCDNDTPNSEEENDPTLHLQCNSKTEQNLTANIDQNKSVAFLPLHDKTRNRTGSLEMENTVSRPVIRKTNSARF